jgi:hypothetical protein
MAVRSKRKTDEFISRTGVKIDQNYCRRCMQFKDPDQFYNATDKYLDSNGLMSICRDCINETYDRLYLSEMSMEKAILKLCRMLNVRFDLRAVDAAKQHMETAEVKGTKYSAIFGMYKMKLGSTQKAKIGERVEEDMTFVEPSLQDVEKINENETLGMEYYEESWGMGLGAEDYHYLEQEFAKWKRTTKCDTQGEEVLVKELCYKQNEIRKARIEGKSVDTLVKSLQEIMKNSALTPALQNAASAGKMADTFGVWIKEIESMTPAEFYEDKLKYKDIDGIDEYNQKYITRPLGNFITGSRDFNTGDLEEINDIDDLGFDIPETGG